MLVVMMIHHLIANSPQQFRKLPEVWWYTDEETSKSDALDSRKRFRDGSLGSRHALAAYGYEHRRTEGGSGGERCGQGRGAGSRAALGFLL